MSAAPVAVPVPAPAPVEVMEPMPAEMTEPSEEALMQALNETCGQGPRICILGGTKFNDEASEPLVQALAREVATRFDGTGVVALTGGMAGVQETFSKHAGPDFPMVHMLPIGQESNFGVGSDFAFFRDLPHRIDVFGQVGDIYITVEGGPGVSKEANAAHARGALVLPLISTGGASGGMFDFPAGALERPDFATPEQWELLKQKGDPEASAQAVVDMIVTRLTP